MTPAEIERLARMTASIRPDWPVQSLKTMLTNFTHSQPHRSYPDTAHALLTIALDPATKNPGRLAETGPWWQTRPGTEPRRPITTGPDATFCDRCRGVIAPGETGHTCQPTRTEISTEARAAARAAITRHQPPVPEQATTT